MTLYKGPIIDFVKGGGASQHHETSESSGTHSVTGPLMLLASCCGWASFFILQVIKPFNSLSINLETSNFLNTNSKTSFCTSHLH